MGGKTLSTKDALKWIAKLSLSAIFWIFILSIRVDNRTLFSYANNFLVQNSFLEIVDTIADTLYNVSDAAKTTFSEEGKDHKSKARKM